MDISDNVHFLIVGSSQNHVFTILKHYSPRKIYLISSLELQKSIEELKIKIESENVDVELIMVDPFNQDSLVNIVSEISSRVKKIQQESPKTKIYIGFTGGTNIMAIAAGYSALLLHSEAHYVMKDNEQIIEIHPDQVLDSIGSKK